MVFYTNPCSLQYYIPNTQSQVQFYRKLITCIIAGQIFIVIMLRILSIIKNHDLRSIKRFLVKKKSKQQTIIQTMQTLINQHGIQNKNKLNQEGKTEKILENNENHKNNKNRLNNKNKDRNQNNIQDNRNNKIKLPQNKILWKNTQTTVGNNVLNISKKTQEKVSDKMNKVSVQNTQDSKAQAMNLIFKKQIQVMIKKNFRQSQRKAKFESNNEQSSQEQSNESVQSNQQNELGLSDQQSNDNESESYFTEEEYINNQVENNKNFLNIYEMRLSRNQSQFGFNLLLGHFFVCILIGRIFNPNIWTIMLGFAHLTALIGLIVTFMCSKRENFINENNISSKDNNKKEVSNNLNINKINQTNEDKKNNPSDKIRIENSDTFIKDNETNGLKLETQNLEQSQSRCSEIKSSTMPIVFVSLIMVINISLLTIALIQMKSSYYNFNLSKCS